jgi:hypothetical protein
MPCRRPMSESGPIADSCTTARKPIDLPTAVARALVEDMGAFFAAPNQIKADEIAAHQLHALRQHHNGKLEPKLTDERETFLRR